MSCDLSDYLPSVLSAPAGIRGTALQGHVIVLTTTGPTADIIE